MLLETDVRKRFLIFYMQKAVHAYSFSLQIESQFLNKYAKKIFRADISGLKMNFVVSWIFCMEQPFLIAIFKNCTTGSSFTVYLNGFEYKAVYRGNKSLNLSIWTKMVRKSEIENFSISFLSMHRVIWTQDLRPGL